MPVKFADQRAGPEGDHRTLYCRSGDSVVLFRRRKYRHLCRIEGIFRELSYPPGSLGNVKFFQPYAVLKNGKADCFDCLIATVLFRSIIRPAVVLSCSAFYMGHVAIEQHAKSFERRRPYRDQSERFDADLR